MNSQEGKRVYDLDRAHVFHSWSAQSTLAPMTIAGAEGSWVWDYDGNRFLDISSQLVNVNIGHQHPKVIQAITDQASVLSTISPNHANDKRGEAAQRITALAPAHLNKDDFTNGGADAVENAIRMARIHTGKRKVLSFYRSYHGNTGAAIASTGDPRRWPNEYADAHVHFFGPYLYRSSFWATTPEQESERALAHLEQVIQFEGPGTIAALLMESVVGTAGILVPPPGYLEGVRELCNRYGIVWIADEVMCGFGRTGKWFAFDHFNAQPDLITFAKGVNSGYVIAATFDNQVFPGGLTYSGHPLAAASIVATLDAMRDEGIVENSAMIGETVLGPGLRELQEKHPVIGEVRGLGVFWAVELVTDRATKDPLAPYGGSSPAMNEFVSECKKNGLLPFTNYNRIHVVPPCTITVDEMNEALVRLDSALSAIDKHYVGA